MNVEDSPSISSGKKYINVEINGVLHRQIKIRAAEEGISITEWINGMLQGKFKPAEIKPHTYLKIDPKVKVEEKPVTNLITRENSVFKTCQHGAKIGLCKRGCKK